MRYSSWICDCGFLDYNFLDTFLLVLFRFQLVTHACFIAAYIIQLQDRMKRKTFSFERKLFPQDIYKQEK